MSRILQVIPKENHCLEVRLENGSSVLLNLESRLSTVRFGALSDPEFFKQVTTDGIFIRWERKVELTVDEVFQLAQR